MIPAAIVAGAGANLTSAAMIEGVKILYGVSKCVNEFLNDHICEMKGSDNLTISRTGRVLEAAKTGFGIGYLTPVVIIATGQLILGNSLSAVTTVATAATLTNPIAMTCAATGAIFYGWWALSDQERNELLEKLSDGLQVGVELIKSAIGFVIDKMKELFETKHLNELKNYICDAAGLFGKTLGDITNKLSDKVSDTLKSVKEKTGETIDKTAELTSNTYDAVKETAGKASHGAIETLGKIKPGKNKDSE